MKIIIINIIKKQLFVLIKMFSEKSQRMNTPFIL